MRSMATIFKDVTRTAVFILVVMNTRLVFAELVFTAPPREQVTAGKLLYEPIADYLSELLGEKVVYQHPHNWLQYQRDLKRDHYDIVFDGPHFVSWRMAHLDHQVLVKLPGSLVFVILARKEDKALVKLNDLIGKKICAIPPPNLGTLTTLEQFPNPARQPIIWGVKGGFRKVYKEFIAGKCDAAVLRSNVYNDRLTEKQRSRLTILFRTKPLPNQAISVSKRVDAEARAKIIRSISLTQAGKDATDKLRKRFDGKKARLFEKARDKDYEAHTELLEGIVFGW